MLKTIDSARLVANKLQEMRRKRMGKYAEALGIWKHAIGNVEHSLVPKMGDNDKIANIIRSYQQSKDLGSLMKNIRATYVEFVLRDYPQLKGGEDEKELLLWAEVHQRQIMEDMLIAYKWQTKEDLEKAKKEQGDSLKNLM